jgi:LEA14-like dessication related protein
VETPVATAPAPEFSLRFDRIEAASPVHVSLFYTLEGISGWEISAWEFLLNGEDLSARSPKVKALTLETLPAAAGALDLKLDLDLPAPSAEAVGEGSSLDEYQSELRVHLAPAGVPSGSLGVFLSANATFPRIREPEFTIVSIAVMQAELINTRFRVDLRIDNPNLFPVELSSLSYELYGSGRFWADGKEKTTLEVPSKGSAETRLILTMNFINMRRELLDEVIAMGQVPYRFTGEALVDTGIKLLPRFRVEFDRSGTSLVVK